MRHRPITHRNRGLQSAMALAFALTLTACSSNDNASRQMTSFSANSLAVGDAAAVHHSRRPDEPRAGGDGCSPTTLTHTLRLTGAVAYNAFNTTPVITQVGGPVSRILVVPGRACESGPADAGGEQPGLRAVAGRLSEGRGFFPPGGQVLRARAGPVCAPRHCAARSGAGGEQSHPGAGRSERGRAGHADSGHQESGGPGEGAVVRRRFRCWRRSPARSWSGWFRRARWCRRGRRRHSPSPT